MKRLVRQEQRELIRRTMETLPQKDRDIARAFYLEGASYDELTSTHGLSYNAIAFRLFRIKRQLSKRLRYLLTGVFVSPGLTLKKLYTRGLTIMKVGTAPEDDGWSDRVDCADYYRFRWATPDECAYSRRACVSVSMGGWSCASTKQSRRTPN